jgi:GDP-mannose 4,6-dehydratase
MMSSPENSTKSKVLITGITGMVGSHMADFLLDKAEVIGLKRWRSPEDNIQGLSPSIEDIKVKLFNGDLKDLSSMLALIINQKPDIIYHFAAQSYVPISYTMPNETLQDNILGTLNLLEAVRLAGIKPKIIIASSSEVYGQVTEKDIPITEDCPFRPVSPYAVSKVGEDMLGYQYFKSYGMDIVRTRLFTHTGPRRGWCFVESLFAFQIAMVEAGKQSCVYNHGSEESLKSVRTWLDVRDAVKAYWMCKDCPPGEVYNIGGDKTMTVGEMLKHLLSLSTVKNIPIVTDGKWLRPSDVTLQIPDTSKFRKQTGWAPEIPFEKTMLDLLNYWRERV